MTYRRGSLHPLTKRGTNMNMIVRLDKTEQFQEDFRAFLAQVDNQIIRSAFDQRPRSVHVIVHALQNFIGQGFSTEDMEAVVDLVETGDSDIKQLDESISDRLAKIEQARRLMDLYAQIHGAPAITAGKRPVYDWNDVARFDAITV